MRAIGMVKQLRFGALLSTTLLTALLGSSVIAPVHADEPTPAPARPSKFKDFGEVTKEAKKIEASSTCTRTKITSTP